MILSALLSVAVPVGSVAEDKLAAPQGPFDAIRVHPETVRLTGPLDRVQIVVTGVRPNGRLVDVTRFASFTPSVAGAVAVDRGRVVPLSEGRCQLRVAMGGRHLDVPVEVSRLANPPRVPFANGLLVALSKQGCNSGGCHGAPSGKGGFRLSLRGFDPRLDTQTLIREQFSRRVNVVDPDTSLLLRKPLMRVAHGGGQRLEKSDPAYGVIRRWIAEGCRPDSDKAARCVRTEVFPRDRVIKSPAESLQLRVVAHMDDGSQRDVTHLAVYTSSDETRAQVDRRGQVTSNRQGTGQVGILVRYLEKMEAARITLVEDRPGFTWPEQDNANEVDRLIHQRLKVLQIPPSPNSSDAQFHRRVRLDVTGLIPTAAEARAFLADKSPDKRNRLIDELLKSDDHARFWAGKWADMFRVTRAKLGARGVDKFHRWLVASIRDNQPYSEFVTELLTAQGDTFSTPAANYYRAASDTSDATEMTARHFLGIRIQCAKCHNHPYERWTQANYYGIGAFFLRIKRTKPDKHGNMVVWVSRRGETKNPYTGETAPPWLPLTGPADIKDPQADRRAVLARWLVRDDNPMFARVEVNRLWAWACGRGIIEPVDDFRASNPPSHAELLDWLAVEFRRSGFDRRHILRLILRSHTYQRDSLATPLNKVDTDSFSHGLVRRLTAEQILDAVCQVTGIPESFPNVPPGTRATQLPSPEGSPAFLRIFGKPKRETSCDCERQGQSTLTQFLTLANGSLLNDKIMNPGNRFRLQIDKGWTDKQIVEDLILAAFGRFPTSKEHEAAAKHLELHGPEKRVIAHEDIQWAILNSKDFLFQH